MSTHERALLRIAAAAERIAEALEEKRGSGMLVGPLEVRLDGKVLAREVIRHTLQRAARGPSSLVGGSLTTDASSEGTSEQ